jgi:PAS domain S-box-containing protein
LASRSPGGFIARRLTFTIVATSLFFGWACLVGFQRNMLSPVVALSLLASINAVLAIAWINGVGRELNFMDEQRVNSERFLEEIIDAAPAVIYLRDLKGNLLRSNREFEQVRAACSEEQALFPPDGELSPAEARVLSERAGHSQEIECRMHGEKHTFLSQHFPVFNKLDRLVAIGVVATDITDRKKMEVALRKSEESFRVLADAIPVVVWTSDDQGRASYFNFRWLEYTGLELAESLDFGWKRALHPDDAETVQKALARGTVTLDPLAIETRLRRRDGTYRWHSTRAIPTVENNKLVRWFGTCIDIDDQKRLNDILENKVAERTQALTRVNHELEAFSYSVSHDLRAPLRSMDGFSRLVLEKYGDKIDDQGRSYLNRVRSASQSMAGIIEDLLMLSRIGRTEIVRESVDLSQLAEEIIDEKRRVEPERNVDVRIEGHLHAVGDASLLRIALFNLFDNAWKYTSKRNPSRIEFFSRNEPNGKKIFIVRDNGEGFDMAHADQLFKAFSRLHRSVEFPGTGIGLVTARRIFERHGGEIWAESALGQGATFSFTVPNKTVPNKREAQ